MSTIPSLPKLRGFNALGPVLTVAVIALVEIAGGFGVRIPNPPAILMTLCVVSTFSGGASSGVFSAVATCAYLAVFYADSRLPFSYSSGNGLRVIVALITVPIVVALAAISKRRGDGLAEQALNQERDHSSNLRRVLRQRERIEAALVDAKKAAEEASRSKSEFIANVSHEVRTPMNGIIGMTELALQTELTREQREHLEAVRSSADSLLMIINDLLDFSKIEAGKLELQPVPFDVYALMNDIMRSLALRAHERRLELICEIHPNVPGALRGDPLRLRQVLVNLVSNAIKFTERGEIEVSVQSVDHGIRFSVRDTGIGIAEDKQEAIFEPFSQADGSATRRFMGTGLGLAISTRLVRAMGGSIEVKSEIRHGSTFTIVVPLETAEEVERVSTEPSPALALSRLLIVDDNDTCRAVLRRFLDGLAMSCSAVPTGIDALATLRKAEYQGDPFGLLVVDADMPGLDGFALVERMHAELNHPPRVVMLLTTTQQSNGATRCRRLGIPNYVIKPVRTGRLLRALSQAVTSTPEPSAPASDPRGSSASLPPRSLHALIAEDNAINATLMTRLLERQGHRVTCVEDGRAALDAIINEDFDVAVLDVQMPELGGMEVAWLVRDDEKRRDRYLPMVAVTAHVLKGTRESCLKAGFDAYLSKPIRPDELYEVLDTIVPPSYGEPQQRRRRSFVGNRLVDNRFDRVTLLEHTGHDIELARELVVLFLEEHVKWNAQMRAAVEAGDATELQRVAHMLKGALSHYGAQTATDLALILERMGREGDISNAPTALDELDLTIKRMIPDLEKFMRDRA